MTDNNEIDHLTARTINAKLVIMAATLMMTLTAINAYGYVFAQDSSDSDDSDSSDSSDSNSQDDQPRGSGDDCHYIHGNSGVLSPCHPTAGNPPISVN